MDSALKQRLLGAVVLIALAVIFVPMFLSGPGPRQESETVDLEIPPAPSREFETRVLAVDEVGRAPVPMPMPVDSEPVVAVDATDIPREPPSAPVAEVPVAPAPQPVVTPERIAAGEAARGQYLVHLGVYASSGNADDLVATLKRSGFAAFSEATEFQGKPAQRVRVGPYADRAEAEAARIRIKQLRSDVPGSVIALAEDARADAPAQAVAATRAGGWAVQLGAFKTVDDANKLRGRLQAAGFAGYVDRLAADGQTLWRVRVGPEVDRANADKLRERIKAQLRIDGMIVTQQ